MEIILWTLEVGIYIRTTGDGSKVSKIGGSSWTNSSKVGVSFHTQESYIALGCYGANSLTPAYVVNNGLNPNGNEERNVFYGSTKFTSSIYMNNNGRFFANGNSSIGCDGGFIVISGSLGVSNTGAKNKIFETKDYGTVGVTSFETTEPYFADIGSASISENNCVTVFLDQVFAQTIDRDCSYQVFITRTSEKETDYVEKHNGYFVVHGEYGYRYKQGS